MRGWGGREGGVNAVMLSVWVSVSLCLVLLPHLFQSLHHGRHHPPRSRLWDWGSPSLSVCVCLSVSLSVCLSVWEVVERGS